jgi:coenzyme F420-dependent glucose-6-phosphate dehydrogenase
MGVTIGYHASHEQFSPGRLLQLAVRAREAGFQCLFSSDHFAPWSEAQGQSGYSFAWLGAAMQATGLPARTICCPAFRYHPAIVAQAAATLAEMFEGKFHLAIGSGQALNEHITGEVWPTKAERNARLKEAADLIRALWAGETVTHHGRITIEEAKLYTRPHQQPLLWGAAITEKTAEWMGSWADGLLTTSRKPEEAKRIIGAFAKGGGKDKPMAVKVGLCWAGTDQEAEAEAFRQWKTNAFSSEVLANLRTPAQLDAAAQFVRPGDMHESLRISSSSQQHLDWLAQDVELGFEEIHLHNVGTNQEQFIDYFGENVLPELTKLAGARGEGK